MDRERLRRMRNFQSQDFYPALVIRPLSIAIMVVIGDWTWLTPNLLTTIATLFKVGTAALIFLDARRWDVAACAALQLGLIFDHLDGTMARYRGVSSWFGSYYDKLSDAVAWFLIMAAVGWAAYVQRGEPWLLLLAAAGAYALLVMGYAKWVAEHAVATVAPRPKSPARSEPPDRTAADWARWFLRSLVQIYRFEETDLFLWLGIAMVIHRLHWFIWLCAATQTVGMLKQLITRGLETRRLDRQK